MGVRFDSLAPEAADATFALLATVRPGHDDLGVTIPGRWLRSASDADRAVALNVAVRVVKGQWRDPAAPSIDPGTGFLEVVDRIAGRAARVGVATHDAPLARTALGRLRAAGTPCELELLLGLPFGPALREALDSGVTVRVYVPYGRASLPYSVSRSASKPRALYRVIRDLFLARPVLPPPLNGARPAR